MRSAWRGRLAVLMLAGVVIVLGLCGCSNPYASSPAGGPGSLGDGVQNAGEPRAPAPRQAGARGVVDLQPTAQGALVQFASRYSNWSYRTLASDQLALGATSVGGARLSERQAAASTRADSALARGHISNSGVVLSVSADLARSGWWVVVTSERTSGGGEYEGLSASDHVTLAQVAHVGGGWAVSQWLVQS
jgi:hypothetical protein